MGIADLVALEHELRDRVLLLDYNVNSVIASEEDYLAAKKVRDESTLPEKLARVRMEIETIINNY